MEEKSDGYVVRRAVLERCSSLTFLSKEVVKSYRVQDPVWWCDFYRKTAHTDQCENDQNDLLRMSLPERRVVSYHCGLHNSRRCPSILPADGFVVYWSPTKTNSKSLRRGEDELMFGEVTLKMPFVSFVQWENIYSNVAEQVRTDQASSVVRRRALVSIPSIHAIVNAVKNKAITRRRESKEPVLNQVKKRMKIHGSDLMGLQFVDVYSNDIRTSGFSVFQNIIFPTVRESAEGRGSLM